MSVVTRNSELAEFAVWFVPHHEFDFPMHHAVVVVVIIIINVVVGVIISKVRCRGRLVVGCNGIVVVGRRHWSA